MDKHGWAGGVRGGRKTDLGFFTAPLTIEHTDLTNLVPWLREGEHCLVPMEVWVHSFLVRVVLVPFLHLIWGTVQLPGSEDTSAGPDALAILIVLLALQLAE